MDKIIKKIYFLYSHKTEINLNIIYVRLVALLGARLVIHNPELHNIDFKYVICDGTMLYISDSYRNHTYNENEVKLIINYVKTIPEMKERRSYLINDCIHEKWKEYNL